MLKKEKGEEGDLLKEKTVLIFATTLIILSLMLTGLVITVAASDTGELAFYASPSQSSLGYGASDEVFWRTDALPTSYPFFDLKVNITDVTDFRSVVFSVQWDPTYLNLTAYTPGDFLPSGLPEATGWFVWWDYAEGEMHEAANSFVYGYGPTSVSKPNWGWVMTLTFQYLSPTPSVGSPVDTDIVIVKNATDNMETKWRDNSTVYHDFDYLSYPYVHKCHFHYEAPPLPPVGGKAAPISMPIIKPESQIPWIWLTTIILSLALTVVYVKKRKRHREINS